MINLISPRYKKSLSQEKNVRVITVLIFLLCACLVSLSLFLAFVLISIESRVVIEKELLRAVERDFTSSRESEIEEKVRSYEDMVKLVSSRGGQRSMVDVFDVISNTLSHGMYLRNISYSNQADKISLSGFAPNRDSVTEFKRALEDSFINVSFPSSVWIQKTDIEFTTTFPIYE